MLATRPNRSSAAVAAAPARAKPTILIAEDSADIREMLQLSRKDQRIFLF